MTDAARAIARAKRDNAAAIAQADRDYLAAMQAIVPPISPAPLAEQQAQDAQQGAASGDSQESQP